MSNEIITVMDPDRFPILEAESQLCSVPISDTDAEMIEKMDGILDQLGDSAAGIAAVQIGYPRRIFVLRQEGINRVFINPAIVSQSKETKKRPEACLSLPGLAARIPRPKSLVLQYYDLAGEQHEETFRGFWAQAVCHEMDHLNGQLISEHMQAEFRKVARRTSFGMKITPHRSNVIKKRRNKKRRAKSQKRHLKSIGKG